MHVLNIYPMCFPLPCEVLCCGWHRWRCHGSCPHPACHLFEERNHILCPHSLFGLQRHHRWGDIHYLSKSNDCSTSLPFLSLWYPVIVAVFLWTILLPLPIKNLLSFLTGYGDVLSPGSHSRPWFLPLTLPLHILCYNLTGQLSYFTAQCSSFSPDAVHIVPFL